MAQQQQWQDTSEQMETSEDIQQGVNMDAMEVLHVKRKKTTQTAQMSTTTTTTTSFKSMEKKSSSTSSSSALQNAVKSSTYSKPAAIEEA